MNKQPEALRLADHLDTDHEHLQVSRSEISAELRRLYAENKALNDALKYSTGCHREMSELAVRQRARLDELERLQPKREPLKNEWIRKIESGTHFHESPCWVIRFARAIEAAHNIK